MFKQLERPEKVGGFQPVFPILKTWIKSLTIALMIEARMELIHIKGTAIKDFSDRLSAKFGVEHFMHPYSEKTSPKG